MYTPSLTNKVIYTDNEARAYITWAKKLRFVSQKTTRLMHVNVRKKYACKLLDQR